MLNTSRKKRLLYWSLEILLIMGIIWICSQVSFIFSPIGTFFSSIFVPVIIAGALFYLLSPIVKLMIKIRIGKHHLPRTLAVLFIFAIFFVIVYFLVAHAIPDIVHQISNLLSNMPQITKGTEKTFNKITQHGWLKKLPIKQYLPKIQTYAAARLKSILGLASTGIGSMISTVTSIVINVITIPVMLFYMLKDGYKLRPDIAKFVPKRHRKRTIKLLNKMSDTISHYIDGQMIECLFVGTFTSIGYLIIHQHYAVLLGIFAGFCNIVPYVGPYIGIAPSLMVAFTINIPEVIYVIITVIIVQQIDGNFIYPNVVGKVLKIHPLTIIIILLAAGNIDGIIGMILAVPLYAIAKTVVLYLHSIYVMNHTN